METLKKEGDRKLCTECQIEIHVRKINDRFGERLRWCNPDGSPHFYFDEETGNFEHMPTKASAEDIRIDELEERVSRLERQIGIVRVE